jgi:UDP:flavonoid glycosyltransferase YjiC (YdhE family)
MGVGRQKEFRGVPLRIGFGLVGGGGRGRLTAEELLGALGESGCEAIVVCDGVPAGVRGKLAGARNVRFVDEPLELTRAALAGRFDLAVLNAGHGSTAAMLLAGVPALLVPIHLEQGMLARAAERNTGACAQGDHKDAGQVAARLREMLEPAKLERYRDAARQFAEKYAAFDPAGQVGRMVERVEELMGEKRQGDKGTRGQGAGRAGVFAG